MTNEELLDLLERVSNVNASDEDIKIYNAWCNSFQEKGEPVPDIEHLKLQMHAHISKRIGVSEKHPVKLAVRIAAAAVILIFIGFGGYFLVRKNVKHPVMAVRQPELAPGTNKAVLITANGNHIQLGNSTRGTLAAQGNMVVSSTSMGSIVYQPATDAANDPKIIYNTLITPKGGKINVTLSDGTKVWLDAASSITYPVSFDEKSREVSVSGEVYFEVAHNPDKPFHVRAGGQTVEVLGTHFNINAYDDEPVIKTTLLEGSIRVSGKNDVLILSPGQQSVFSKENGLSKIEHADTEQATAWKNGYFHFNRAGIPEVMRQFSRWYNVDVKYAGSIPGRAFSGDIDRNSNAAVALKILEISRVNFEIDSKTIIVKP